MLYFLRQESKHVISNVNSETILQTSVKMMGIIIKVFNNSYWNEITTIEHFCVRYFANTSLNINDTPSRWT